MPVCELCGNGFPATQWFGPGRVCLPCQMPPPTADKADEDERYKRAVAIADEALGRIFPQRRAR